MQRTEYLAKSKPYTTYCFFLSCWQSLTNKPALHNTTNVFCFLITRSSVSYSLGLPRICSADASFGSFLPSLTLAADSSAHCCSVPAFTPLHNWGDGSLLQFHTITAIAHTYRTEATILQTHVYMTISECSVQLLLVASYIWCWLLFISKTSCKYNLKASM